MSDTITYWQQQAITRQRIINKQDVTIRALRQQLVEFQHIISEQNATIALLREELAGLSTRLDAIEKDIRGR